MIPAKSDGTADITVDPTRRVNTLTLTPMSTAGNLGPAATCDFSVVAAAAGSDQDLSGDGVPDLLATGQTLDQSATFDNPVSGSPETGVSIPAASTGSVPAGLWQAEGTADQGGGTLTDGQVGTAATDIGAYGDGAGATGDAASFTGNQAVIGQFTDSGFNDVLTYDAQTGLGRVLDGDGDGSVLAANVSGNVAPLNAGELAVGDPNVDDPLQVVDGYDAAGDGFAYPDLLAVNGDSADGFYLDYYESNGSPAAYQAPTVLTALSPDGSSDWQNWIISSDVQGGSVNLLLWDPSTGSLVEWSGFTVNTSTGAANYHPYPLSSSFDKNQALAAIRIASAGTTAATGLNTLVWTVSSAGVVTPTLFTNLTASGATATAGSQDTLVTSHHSWALNDAAGGSVGTAADTSGGLSFTGEGTGATWTTGNLFAPDLSLSGSGYLATGAPGAAGDNPLDLTGSFSVSVWVDPSSATGTVLTQDGGSDAGLVLAATAGGWQFQLNTGNGSGAGYDTVTGGTVQVGEWNQLTATYDAGNKFMSLYLDGTLVAVGAHTAPAAGATGPFELGDLLTGSTHGSYYSGQLADVQTWACPLHPIPGSVAAIAAGTSPATAVLSNGEWVDVWQAAGTGDLWFALGTGTTLLEAGDPGTYQLDAGTSPSVATLGNDEWAVAWQTNNGGNLAIATWSLGDLLAEGQPGLGMLAGTSPAITGMSGTSYAVAFQANTGVLWFGTGSGDSLAAGNEEGFGMKAGTSPSIATLTTGKWIITFHANSDMVWILTGSGDTISTFGDPQEFGITAGTNPSVAALANGAYTVTWQAGGSLWTMSGVGANLNSLAGCLTSWDPLGPTVASGSSPSITTVNGTNYAIAYQTTAGLLGIATGSGSTLTASGTPGSLAMAADTSPSIETTGTNAYAVTWQGTAGVLAEAAGSGTTLSGSGFPN